VLVDSRDSGSAVSKEFFVIGSDGLELVFDSSSSSGENSAGDLVGGGAGLDNLSGGVVNKTLLNLTILSGEENELRLVSIKSFNIELKLFLTRRCASVVH